MRLSSFAMVAGLAFGAASVSAEVVDFTRSTDTINFDFSTFGTGNTSTTLPIEVGSSLNITVSGATGSPSAGAELGVNTGGIGVQTNVPGSEDAVINGSAPTGDILTFSFDFAGTLNALDFSSVGGSTSATNNDQVVLKLNGTVIGEYVDFGFFSGGGAPAGTTLLSSPGDDLTDVDLAFAAFDVFSLEGGTSGTSFGLENVTVTPTPATFAMMAGLGLMTVRRQRSV